MEPCDSVSSIASLHFFQKIQSEMLLFHFVASLVMLVISQVNGRIFAQLMGTLGDNDAVRAIAVDNAGNVFVAGYYSTALRITDQTGQGVGSLPSPLGQAGFVVKYAPNGTYLWAARQDTTSTPSIEWVSDTVATDSTGAFYIGVQSNGDPFGAFDSTDLPAPTRSRLGWTDCYLVKYLSNGSVAWTARFGNIANVMYSENINSIVTSSATDEVAVSGFASDGCTFFNANGGIGAAYNYTGEAAFAATYFSNGTVRWVVLFRAGISSRIPSLIYDRSGRNLYVSGYTGSNYVTLTGLPGNVINVTATSSFTYVVKLYSNGSFQWAVKLDAVSQEQISDIVLDMFDNLVIFGQVYSGPLLVFDANNTQTHRLTFQQIGISSAFIVAYFPNGTSIYATKIDAPTSVWPSKLCVGDSGTLYAALSSSATTATFYARDGISAVATLPYVSGTNAAVLAAFSQGNFQWFTRIHGDVDNRGLTCGIMENGDVLLGGYTSSPYSSAYDARGKLLTNFNGPTDGLIDGYVYRFTPNGSVYLQAPAVSSTQRLVFGDLGDAALTASTSSGSSIVVNSRNNEVPVSGGMSTQDVAVIIVGASLGCIMVVAVLVWMRIRSRSRYGTQKTDKPDIRTAMTSMETERISTTAMNTYLSTNHELSIPAFLQMSWGVDFRQEQFVTKGGGGSLYLCSWLSLELAEACKRQQLIVKIVSASGVDELNARTKRGFFQEIALMHKFRNHPGFCRVYAFSLKPACIVMKFYQHGDLQHFICGQGIAAQHFCYSKWQLVSLFRSYCSAIAFMHECGIAHCDVKPENVLLDVIGTQLIPIVTDFGICRIFAEEAIQVDAFEVADIIGVSLRYAAPEVLVHFRKSHKITDARVIKAGDTYALSITLMEMLKKRTVWHKSIHS